MDEIARKYIDVERITSKRSHPTPKNVSVFYDKNQKIEKTPVDSIKYPKYKPNL